MGGACRMSGGDVADDVTAIGVEVAVVGVAVVEDGGVWAVVGRV